METEDSIMTINEVAEYLRLKRVTIYKYSQTRQIPCFKVGSAWRYRKSHIEEWITKKESDRNAI